jgi:integrase
MKNDKSFKSIFKTEFKEILKMKHEQGYKYITQEGDLHMLDNYIHSLGMNEKVLTRDICENWCRKRQNESQGTRRKRVTAIRELVKCLSRKGIHTDSMAGIKVKKSPKYQAYIYSDEELYEFFKAADAYKADSKATRAVKYYPLFFRILYTSGLRLSELINLKIKDFNISESFIIVRNGKNNKDRLVPMNPDLTKRCIDMIKDDGFHVSSDGDDYLFKSSEVDPLSGKSLYGIFRQYLKVAGIRHLGKGHGPRIHDFRSTYAVNILRKWVTEGKDLLNCLPYLQTMMGHKTFIETAYYLKLTSQMFPTLMLKLEEEYPNLIIKDVISEDEEEFY